MYYPIFDVIYGTPLALGVFIMKLLNILHIEINEIGNRLHLP